MPKSDLIRSRYPETWASNEVQAVFETWNLGAENSTSPTGSLPSQTENPPHKTDISTQHSRDSPSKPRSVIIGVSVGVSVFIVSSGIGIWLCVVKRKKTTSKRCMRTWPYSQKLQPDSNLPIALALSSNPVHSSLHTKHSVNSNSEQNQQSTDSGSARSSISNRTYPRGGRADDIQNRGSTDSYFSNNHS
jgi:hypothetical protein